MKPTLIYRPLELDNESSSESSDSINKRLRRSSQIICTPLAIEGPPLSPPPPPLPLPPLATRNGSPRLFKKKLKQPQRHEKKTPNIKPHSDEDEVHIIQITPAKRRKTEHISPELRKSTRRVTKGKPVDMISVYRCITPPITPEKITKDKKSLMSPILEHLPSFIPGNCDIEEVLRLYGKKDGVASSQLQKAPEVI